jgi:hypothetical protein
LAISRAKASQDCARFISVYLSEGTRSHPQAERKPDASRLHGRCPLVSLIFRSYSPLVLRWLPPLSRGDSTGLLPELDSTGLAVIQTKSDFYFGLASVAV